MSKQMEDFQARKQAWQEQVKRQNDLFAEEERQIREEERRKKQSEKENFLEDLKKEIARDYNMSWEQAEILVAQAWERGHSYGYDEVRSYAQDFGEWVEEILDIQRNIDY